MKYLYYFLAMFIIALGSTYVAKSDCPPGFNPIYKTYNVNGCDYNITICVKCDGDVLTMKLDKFSPVDLLCDPIWSASQIAADITKTMKIDPSITILCGSIKPCDSDTTHQYVRWPICWKIAKDLSGSYEYQSCDNDSYCQHEIFSCIDLMTNQIRKSFTNYQLIGNPNCSNNEILPQDVLPGSTSSCFSLQTTCD